jgi:iron complex outermembrane receptor protein
VNTKGIRLCVVMVSCALMAWAQGAGKISGKVVDVSGGGVSGASITLTDLTSGKVVRAKTGADGQFSANGLAPDRYLVTVEKTGFDASSQSVSLATQQSVVVNATLTVATLAQSVVVRGTVIPGARPQPTREQVLKSDQTIRVLDRKQLDAAGPIAGGAQMISSTPGANVFGYGQSGATKYTIQLNGINQGWGGEASGFISPGSLGITFDGVPVSDVASGLWQSATMPQNLLIQNLTVTYGPGDPEHRFYNNIGGGVEFTPIQPTIGTHLSVQGTYGSYNQKNIAFVLNTGGFHGWSTVISGGMGSGDSFRSAPDGFNNHSKDGAVFAKTIRMFSAGSFELGGYYAKSGGFRNQTIPLSQNAGVYYTYDPSTGACSVDTAGTGTNYSQDSSGFYSGLPYNCYNKYDTNALWMIYSRQNLLLNSTTTLTNMTWYSVIHRLHNRLSDVFAGPPGSGQINEWNNPHTDTFGDELGLSKVLPMNTVSVGAYYIHALYNSQNDFYDPSLGGNGPTMTPNQGAKIRSGYFNQDDVALYAQDTFHPIPQLRITPGIRFVAFQTSYSDQAYRVFNLAANDVVLSRHCSLYPKSSDPFQSAGNTTDQGSICGSHESRTGVEPSISAGVMPLHWLTIYGGYSTEYHSPSLGGGGGMFQKVDPRAYLLAEGKYGQVGVKVHFVNAPVLKNTIFGLAYYHLNYDNQEIDYETGLGNEYTSGGSSTFHGVNIFFDDDPLSNLHIFANFNGEAAHFTTFIAGNPPGTSCSTAGVNCYNNLPVSYTPNTTINFGVYYGIARHEHVLIEPRLSYNYTGSQHLWNNVTGAPDSQTMPGFGTANLSFVAPIKKYLNLSLNLTNLFNKKYNEYEYISSGGYFTPFTGDSAGAVLGYPGAPLSTYGTISFQF